MYILICDDEPAGARQVEQLARQHLEQRGIPVQVNALATLVFVVALIIVVSVQVVGARRRKALQAK